MLLQNKDDPVVKNLKSVYWFSATHGNIVNIRLTVIMMMTNTTW